MNQGVMSFKRVEEGLRGNVRLLDHDYPFEEWSEQQCSSRLLAIDTETTVVESRGQVPKLAVVQVFDGKTVFLIRPNDLSAWLNLHRDCAFIAHNVQFDWHVVYRHFRRTRDRVAMKRWLAIIDENRFTDTMLLDQLCRIAAGSPHHTPRNLAEVARQYCGIAIDKQDPYRTRFGETIGRSWETFPIEMWHYAAKDPIVTRLVFRELRTQARRLVAKHRIPTKTLEQFGPLTIRVQVKASIALRQLEINGIYIDESQRDACYDALQQRSAELLNTLSELDAFREVFKRDKQGNLLLSKSGAPRKSMTALRDLLVNAAAKHDIPLDYTDSEQVSTARSYWEQFADAEPFLMAWIELEKVGKLLQFFDKLQASRIHPGYGTLVRTGRTCSRNPNLQQIPAKGNFRHMFVPRPGHVFVIADYSTLELRTLAAHCEDVIGYSVMADQIRAGRDLHGYTASLMTNLDYDEFMSLKRTDRERYDQQRHAAKAFNFGFPGGLGAATFVSFARLSYGLEFTEAEANRFRDMFLHEIYPEVGEYMQSDLTLILAHNLGCKPRSVRRHFKTDGQLGACQRIVRGDPFRRDGTAYDQHFVANCWSSLAELNRCRPLADDIQNQRADPLLERRLFFSHVVAPAGFIRGQTTFCQTRNTPFQSAAATGGKIAAWNLYRAGYRLRGYIHDEFIIEIAEDSDLRRHCDRIDQIMCESMQEVTGDIPIATEYAVASCWSKSAELIENSDGTYGVWYPGDP